MQRFLHHDRQTLENTLSACRALGTAYRARSFDLDDRLEAHLQELEDFFAQRPKGSGAAADVAGMRNTVECARRGVNPATLVKIKTGRREQLAANCFAVITQVTGLLIKEYEGINQTFLEANRLLEPTILSAVQAGLLSEADLTAAKINPAASEALFEGLAAHPDLNQVRRRILLLVSRQDAGLLLFDLLHRL